MNIFKKKGTRGAFPDQDEIVYIQTNNSEPIKFEDVFLILDLLFKNEEKIYPKNKGYAGSNLCFHAITRIHRGEDPLIVSNSFLKNQTRQDMLHSDFKYTDWQKVFCQICGQQVCCHECNTFIWIKQKLKNGCE